MRSTVLLHGSQSSAKSKKLDIFISLCSPNQGQKYIFVRLSMARGLFPTPIFVDPLGVRSLSCRYLGYTEKSSVYIVMPEMCVSSQESSSLVGIKPSGLFIGFCLYVNSLLQPTYLPDSYSPHSESHESKLYGNH